MLRRALLAALLVATALVASAAPAQAASGLTATFSAAHNGSWWLDKYILALGVIMSNFYNVTATQSGNGTVAAGASTEPYSPWFIAYGGGTAPLNCRISGNKCDGSADRPPSAPANLAVTGHQANLYRDTQDPYSFEFSVSKAIQTYLDAGVNPRQLTIGFPFYGRGWQGVTTGGANGEWQSATGAAPGQFQEEAGTRGYSNLIAMVPNCTIHHDTSIDVGLLPHRQRRAVVEHR